MKMKKKPTLNAIDNKNVSGKPDRQNEISHFPKDPAIPTVTGFVRKSKELIPSPTDAKVAIKASDRTQVQNENTEKEITGKQDRQNLKFGLGSNDILRYVEDHGE